MKTNMLFMEDNYIRSFDAKIISKGENYVVLDQTAFYPKGGGQECDIGTLAYDDKILSISEVWKESGEVRHFIEEIDLIPEIGVAVKCELDWNRRYTHMRYHTAIHILSSFMKVNFGSECVGNNISTRNGRADFNLEDALTEEQLKQIENGINKVISKNLPVKVNFYPREEAIAFLEERGYQTNYIAMVPPAVKTFRVISVNNYDHASCAGTHVKNTKEIGKIKVIKRRSMGKGKERVTLSLD